MPACESGILLDRIASVLVSDLNGSRNISADDFKSDGIQFLKFNS